MDNKACAYYSPKTIIHSRGKRLSNTVGSRQRDESAPGIEKERGEGLDRAHVTMYCAGSRHSQSASQPDECTDVRKPQGREEAE